MRHALTGVPLFGLFGLIAQGFPGFHGHLAAISCKGEVHRLPVRSRGDQAHQWHDHEPGQHGEGTAVDGRLEQCREGGARKQVQHHDARAEDEAHPDRCAAGALHVQAVEEGSQEGTRQSAPGHAHELSDKGHVLLVLNDGQDHGDQDEDHDQNAHGQHLLFLVHLLDDIVLEQVQGQRGGAGQHQAGQGGHGRREHQDHDHAQQQGRKGFQHGGHHGVKAVGRDIDAVGIQASEAAQEVASAGHYQREEGGDDGALGDGGLCLDGIELLHHLGQAPGTETGQDHHAQKVQRVRTEEGGKDAGHIAHRGILHAGKSADRADEAAALIQHGQHHRHNTHEHDQALNEVIDGRGHVAARDHVDAGEHGHQDDAHGVINVERHGEQPGKAVVQGSRVGDQEDEDNGAGADLQCLAPEPLFKEVGHGAAVQLLGHDTGSSAQNHPGHQGADKGISKAHPGAGKTVLPAELARIAHEDNGGEIACAVGKGGEPRSH